DPPRPPRRARILVIDDEQAIVQLVSDALSAEGHQVELAMSGREGVQLAVLSHFDMVLTDLGMPDMSGWEVASRIRKDSPDVPVVLVTGWGASIDEDEVRRHGVAAVVHKPFEIRELLQTTAAILERAEAAPA
ncbi:MAG TPA: response regulator, partial [Candidatus Polarisedimenticolaceae bacterium]|nr:response regulator [Candidatus Polarisedimenticolaceae bacterium]